MSQVRRLEYYRHAARFWLKASELQRTRCLSQPGDSDMARADLNFYVVAVQRLREVARLAVDRGQVLSAASALDVFESAWPRFKEVRNFEEHSTGPGSAQPPYGVWYFSHAVADLGPRGSVEFLVRVEETQESVRKLADALDHAFSSKLASSAGG